MNQQIEACNSDWVKTKEDVESLIARPKPSEKLLSKPPFRFLHDVISEIIRSTGFGNGESYTIICHPIKLSCRETGFKWCSVLYTGLYNEEESDSSKVVDKGEHLPFHVLSAGPGTLICGAPLSCLIADAKINYLTKIIKLVGVQLNTLVEARPNKIVAGLEPENTNRCVHLPPPHYVMGRPIDD